MLPGVVVAHACGGTRTGPQLEDQLAQGMGLQDVSDYLLGSGGGLGRKPEKLVEKFKIFLWMGPTGEVELGVAPVGEGGAG